MMRFEDWAKEQWTKEGPVKFVETILKGSMCASVEQRNIGVHGLIEAIALVNGCEAPNWSEEKGKADLRDIRCKIARSFDVDPALMSEEIEKNIPLSAVARRVVMSPMLGTDLKFDIQVINRYCKEHAASEYDVLCYLIGVILCNGYKFGTKTNGHILCEDDAASYVNDICVRLVHNGYVPNITERPIWEVLEQTTDLKKIGELYAFGTST